MKISVSAAAIVGLTLMTTISVTAFAQAPTTPAAPPAAAPAPTPDSSAPDRVTGAVTAVNAAANTITVHDRQSDSDINVAVTVDTKFTKSTNVGLAGLAVGNIVSIYNREGFTAGATTVEAGRLSIEDALPKATAEPNTHTLWGTVVTTTPTLTIKGIDNTVVTVTTAPETQVLQQQPAALTDIAVGQRVRVVGKNDGTTLTAKSVAIQPARPPRPAGQ